MKDINMIRKAIDAALISASNVSNKGEFFVVEVIPGECAFVCDHFGTIDGPYRTVDAKTVTAQENEFYGF